MADFPENKHRTDTNWREIGLGCLSLILIAGDILCVSLLCVGLFQHDLSIFLGGIIVFIILEIINRLRR